MRFLLLFLLCVWLPVSAADDFARERARLVEEVAREARHASHVLPERGFDPAVLAVLGKVPRHEFVAARQHSLAYANRPLPIGYGQTISQPFIVALMTDLLDLKGDETVLEIGTGSGYQAAILAELCRQVYSMEIIEPLAQEAQARLARLGYRNIELKVGDGYYGWKEMGPFDAIIVTAVAGHVPPPLVDQLKAGGRMVIPVGAPFHTQELVLLTKDREGRIAMHVILPVAFVALTGGPAP
jgi:protein-L-isoaspartate(D-aspartate) O-methyltransferase